ncbi:hypothetical protein [Nocardioides alcanivorans]|uniref:hypothetical protein n=1 Tax=Nocardioides alcanivorans TaxID=2897352 RepID=UPI001F291B73|nr:hypothetical protein [Nocardioides alcanivorans]
MGLRTLMRTTTTLVATTVVAALLTAPSATARPCHGCDDPELPGPGGPNCPTINATTDPWIEAPVSPAQPKVGDTVTARTGVWSNASSMKVRWYVGTSGVGSTQSFASYVSNRTLSYTVKADDIGKPVRLWVRGLGSDPACVKDEFSDDTAAATQGSAPVPSSAPTVTGTPKVGVTLRANPGVWSPTPDSFEYVWRWHGGDDDGTHRGTGRDYTPTGADQGKQLRVEVSTVLAGHLAATRTPTTATVLPGDAVTASTAPSVTGNPVYGETLTVDDGAWAPTPTSIDRQWLRDGQPIAGATAATYQPGVKDVGTTVSVRVNAQRDGHPSGTATVAVGKVQLAPKPVWTGKKVALKGKDKVKKKVKVALGPKKILKRAAAPDAKITYQWLRNGKALKKSTKKAHQIKKADRKKRLKARITITRPGHHPLVITTKAVKIKNNAKLIR